MLKCLFLNTFYQGFLNQVYAHFDLTNATYTEHLHAINCPLFGDSDFYSRHLSTHGFETRDIVINCKQAQIQWALENGLTTTNLFDILVSQVEEFQPDIFYIQDLSYLGRSHIQTLKSVTGKRSKIVGQIASPLSPQTPLNLYDLIISSFPHFVDKFSQQGIPSQYQPLAFEPSVLNRITTDTRDIPVSFVGGISSLHSTGTITLSTLAEKHALSIWGYGHECLPEEHILRRNHNGSVYGIDMFQILGRSKITLNRHIDVAENNANNMRMYEATGCGALLITDYRDNLNNLFEIGKEVVAYRSLEEASALINYYSTHPEKALQIANAGQKRTLKDHTYKKRMSQSAQWLREILSSNHHYHESGNKHALKSQTNSSTL